MCDSVQLRLQRASQPKVHSLTWGVSNILLIKAPSYPIVQEAAQGTATGGQQTLICTQVQPLRQFSAWGKQKCACQSLGIIDWV